MNRRFITNPSVTLIACAIQMGCASSEQPQPTERPYAPATTLAERTQATEAQRLRPPGAPRATSKENASNPQPKGTAQPTSIEQELALTSQLLQMGDLPQALETSHRLWLDLEAKRLRPLDEELALEPQRRVALVYAVARTTANNDPAAVRLLERLSGTNPNWEPPYVALASHYIRQSANALALRVTRTGLDRVEKPGPALFALQTKALLLQNEVTKAQETLNRGVRLNPRSALLTEWEGHVAEQRNDNQRACERFRVSYELDTARPSAAHNHALCLTRTGDFDTANNVLRLSLAQSPRAAHLRLLAGYVLRRQGQLAEARRAWSDFLALAPSDDPMRQQVQIEMERMGESLGGEASAVPAVRP
jgi:Flp pilus assembly protein TadD